MAVTENACDVNSPAACVRQVSAFYVSANPPRSLVRFCFCKTDDKLQRACDALEEFFGKKRQLENGA